MSTQTTSIGAWLRRTEETWNRCRVSYRVLNYAFRDVYGVSPGRLLRTKKLHTARRLLRSNGTSVIEAALSVGLNSPSRFASQYRQLFHELPSATRRSGNGGPSS